MRSAARTGQLRPGPRATTPTGAPGGKNVAAAEANTSTQPVDDAWEAVLAADAEVIVVGLGVGGEFVAGRLAEAGLGVVGIESALVGGECPY